MDEIADGVRVHDQRAGVRAAVEAPVGDPKSPELRRCDRAAGPPRIRELSRCHARDRVRERRRLEREQGEQQELHRHVVCRPMRWVALPALVAVWLRPPLPAEVRRRLGRMPGEHLPTGLASSGQAAQLVTVVAARRSSTQGTLRLWRRTGRCWRTAAGPWTAWLGQRGVSATKHEGDRTTPAGTFGFARVMYGIAPSPGLPLRLSPHRLRRLVGRGSELAVLQPLPPRALRLEPAVPGHERGHVALADRLPEPRGDRLQQRTRWIPGRGSGIFLHASTGRPTLGCVSLPLPDLLVCAALAATGEQAADRDRRGDGPS